MRTPMVDTEGSDATEFCPLVCETGEMGEP